MPLTSGTEVCLTTRFQIRRKDIKYLMGHTDIGVTLNTYTHLGLIDAEQELERMEREVKMSEKIERRKRRRKSVGE